MFQKVDITNDYLNEFLLKYSAAHALIKLDLNSLGY